MTLNRLCCFMLLSSVLMSCGSENAVSSNDVGTMPDESVQISDVPAQELKGAPNPQIVKTEANVDIVDPVLKRGKRMFLRCKSCHTVDAGGRHGTGPNIYGFIGVEAAKKEGFKYSTAMKTSGVIWTDDALNAWLEKPRALVPGTSMAFVGIKKAEDRDALILYLKKVTN